MTQTFIQVVYDCFTMCQSCFSILMPDTIQHSVSSKANILRTETLEQQHSDHPSEIFMYNLSEKVTLSFQEHTVGHSKPRQHHQLLKGQPQRQDL